MVGLQLSYAFADKRGYLDGAKDRMASGYASLRGKSYTSMPSGVAGSSAAAFVSSSYGSSSATVSSI